MSTVSVHYENLLAEYYSWMFGDFGARVEANRGFFSGNGIVPLKSGAAVDLGAGSGFQSMALAQLGFKVLAIDLSRKLLDELRSKKGTHPIMTIQEDMLNFRVHCPEAIELCVCMGDTLTHLESFDKIAALFELVYGALGQGGKFVMTFRDLTTELKGLDRFIPVRSDANTVFTCFLEYGPDSVQVHDLIYVRNDDAWELRKSSYRKLRIPPAWVLERLKATGFTIKSSDNASGMVTIIAEKSS